MEYLVSSMLGFIASEIQSDKFKKFGKVFNFLVAIGSCFILSAILAYFEYFKDGNFDVNELLAILGVTFTSSQAYYNLYFKDKLKPNE